MSFLALKAEYLKEKKSVIDIPLFAYHQKKGEFDFYLPDENCDWVNYQGAQVFSHARAYDFQIVEVEGYEMLVSFTLEQDKSDLYGKCGYIPAVIERETCYLTESLEAIEGIALPAGFAAWLEARRIQDELLPLLSSACLEKPKSKSL